MRAIKVLIIEVDQIRREGLVRILSGELDLRVIGAGGDVLQALEGISPTSTPDVVIINMDNPASAAARNWALLRSALPEASIMALTRGDDDWILEASLGLGVIALYRHDADVRSICQAVRNAAQGRVDVDPLLVERLKRILMFQAQESKGHLGVLQRPMRMTEAATLKSPVHLTKREKEVLELLREAKSNRQIALLLGIKPKTVEFHVSNLLKKLGVASRIEAVVLAPWIRPDS